MRWDEMGSRSRWWARKLGAHDARSLEEVVCDKGLVWDERRRGVCETWTLPIILGGSSGMPRRRRLQGVGIGIWRQWMAVLGREAPPAPAPRVYACPCCHRGLVMKGRRLRPVEEVERVGAPAGERTAATETDLWSRDVHEV